MKKTWNIPVTWEECGVVRIEANSLEEAMKIAVNDPTVELPDGEYVDGSFDLSFSNSDDVLALYNKGEEK